MSKEQQTTSTGVRIYRGEYAAHVHLHSQVLFGLSGCLELDIEGCAARVDGITGLVVPAGMTHSYCTGSETKVWVIDAASNDSLEKLRAFQLPQGWWALSDTEQLLASIADAPRVLQRRVIKPEELRILVLAALNETWTTTRMASLFDLSPPQFHRRWRALTGETPQRWLCRIRLDQASSLIKEGLSLELVAARVGYQSASALCQALQREQGMGARQLRRAPR